MAFLQRVARGTGHLTRTLNTTATNRETSYQAFKRLQSNFEKIKEVDPIDTDLKG